MAPIFFIVYLMTVAKSQSKWLLIFDFFTWGSPYLPFVVDLCIIPFQLTKSNPQFHNLQHVVNIFEEEDMEWIIILCIRLQHV